MGISDILSENMILADVEAENKRQLLEKLSDFVSKQADLDKNSVFEAILERENLGSTGYGAGVALPHARINGMTKVVVTFARVSTPVDYDALDNKPVDLVAFLLSPENSGEDHLQSLAVISRILNNEDVCQEIRAAKTVHEIYLALNKK
jgi:PTS system nitrogen regulatory IIA component